MLRKHGFDVSPDKVAEMDPFWLNASIIWEQVRNSPMIEKARRWAEESAEERAGRKKRGGHLRDVSADVPPDA